MNDARNDLDLSDLKVLGIDEFSVEKHHVYVTLFYDIKNSRIIHIEEGKESDVFGKCNRRLIFVHFRRNKSDPDRRFKFDPFHHMEVDQDCTGWRCGEWVKGVWGGSIISRLSCTTLDRRLQKVHNEASIP